MSNLRPSSNPTLGTCLQDNLIAGDFPIKTDSVVLQSGQDLKRGAVLGKITASGKVVLSLSASSDGSQVPFAILSEDTTAAADTVVPVYLSGDFNQRALTFGTGHTAASTKDGLRNLNIYLKDSVAQ